MLSTRAQKNLSEPSPLIVAHFAATQNPYHPANNPTGLINLGTAENYLMGDESLAWVNHPLVLQEHALHYSEFRGSAGLRERLASFLRESSGMAEVGADNIVIGNGVSCLLESLAYTLFDAGDSILIPSPCYTGYSEDFHHRFGVNIIAAPMRATEEFALNSDILRKVYDDALQDGARVKALLINSPNNPTGRQYPRGEIEKAVAFAEEAGLQVIADEIYAHSLFEPEKNRFESVWDIAPHYRDSIHILYGLAKDFGLSGFKFAIYCAGHPEAVEAMSRNAYFYNVSTHTQALVERLFSAPDELNRFLARYQQRLCTAHQHLQRCNHQTLGLPMATSQGGHFVLLDFSALLEAPTFDAETALYYRIWREAKVNITPGQYFACQTPGWFRLCFANHAATVTEAFRRMGEILPTAGKR